MPDVAREEEDIARREDALKATRVRKRREAAQIDVLRVSDHRIIVPCVTDCIGIQFERLRGREERDALAASYLSKEIMKGVKVHWRRSCASTGPQLA